MNAAEDSDDPFKELENDLTELQKIDPMLVPQDLTAQEIADVDINVITTDNQKLMKRFWNQCSQIKMKKPMGTTVLR